MGRGKAGRAWVDRSNSHGSIRRRGERNRAPLAVARGGDPRVSGSCEADSARRGASQRRPSPVGGPRASFGVAGVEDTQNSAGHFEVADQETGDLASMVGGGTQGPGAKRCVCRTRSPVRPPMELASSSRRPQPRLSPSDTESARISYDRGDLAGFRESSPVRPALMRAVTSGSDSEASGPHSRPNIKSRRNADRAPLARARFPRRGGSDASPFGGISVCSSNLSGGPYHARPNRSHTLFGFATSTPGDDVVVASRVEGHNRVSKLIVVCPESHRQVPYRRWPGRRGRRRKEVRSVFGLSRRERAVSVRSGLEADWWRGVRRTDSRGWRARLVARSGDSLTF